MEYIKLQFSTNEKSIDTKVGRDSLHVDVLNTMGPYFRVIWISNKMDAYV